MVTPARSCVSRGPAAVSAIARRGRSALHHREQFPREAAGELLALQREQLFRPFQVVCRTERQSACGGSRRGQGRGIHGTKTSICMRSTDHNFWQPGTTHWISAALSGSWSQMTGSASMSAAGTTQLGKKSRLTTECTLVPRRPGWDQARRSSFQWPSPARPPRPLLPRWPLPGMIHLPCHRTGWSRRCKDPCACGSLARLCLERR